MKPMKPIETDYVELISIFRGAKHYFKERGKTKKVERILELINAITDNDAYEMVIIERPF